MNFSVRLPLDGCLRLCNEHFIHYTCFPARDIEILVDDMRWLRNRKEGTERDLQALEAAGEIKRNNEIRLWLEHVESTNDEVDALVHRLSRRRWGLFCCINLRSNYKCGKEVQKLLRRIKVLQQERGGLGEHDKLTIKVKRLLKTQGTQQQGNGGEVQQTGEYPWYLFCNSIKGGKANVGDIGDPIMNQHAHVIVAECQEYPLAIVSVGRVVRNYQLSEQWETAIRRLKDPPASHQPNPGKLTIESILRFCYDSLDNDLLRSCLLFCSLYPKNHIISEMQLILSWMGEGLLDDEDGSLDFFNAYESGLDVIRKLSYSCLLNYCKDRSDFYLQIPNDVWDMAHHITNSHGNPYVVYSGNSVEFSLRFWATAMRISITELDPSLPGANLIFNCMPNSDSTSLPDETPRCLKLTTLWSNGNRKLQSIRQDFCHFIPVVRVVDLSYTHIKEISRTINILTQLQYLVLEKTRLTKLPIELGDLKNLRMLDLSYTEELKEIPSVSISGLSALHSLRMNESGYMWDLNEEQLVDVGSSLLQLDDLINLRQMQSLWLKMMSIPTLELLLKRFIGVTGLTLSGKHFNQQYVEKIFRRLSQLRWLELYNCTKVEHLEIIRIELRFLEELKLRALSELSNISSKDGSPLLPYLRHLGIWRCNSLKNLTWAGQLPVLELLCLDDCKQMKQLIAKNEEESASMIGEPFPKLQLLVLHQLPELIRFSWKQTLCLPRLRTVRVRDCPKLMKLNLAIKSGKNISKIRGSQEWWDKLHAVG